MNCSSSGLWKRRCSCTDLHVCFWGWRHFRFHLIDHGYVSALPTSPSLACRAVWTLSLSPVLRVLSCFSDSYTILPHARSCSCRGLDLSLGLLFKKKRKRSNESINSTGQEDWWLVLFLFLTGFAAVAHLKELHWSPISWNAHGEITNEITIHWPTSCCRFIPLKLRQSRHPGVQDNPWRLGSIHHNF